MNRDYVLTLIAIVLLVLIFTIESDQRVGENFQQALTARDLLQ